MTTQIKFTYEDYQLFPENGKRHELIDGEHLMTPAPGTKHQKVSRNILSLLHSYLKHTKRGDVFDAPYDVVLSDTDVVQPDLLFVSTGRASIITEKNIQGAPDLIIEILSETTRKTDEITKRKLYERHGVRTYWIVDPELETVKMYQLQEQGYGRATELARKSGEILSTLLLPGLTIPLAEIFE